MRSKTLGGFVERCLAPRRNREHLVGTFVASLRALRSLLDDFGHDERDVHRVVREVLDKLPDEHDIRAIDLGRELRAMRDAGY